MDSGSLKNPAPHGFGFVGRVDVPCRADVLVGLNELGALACFQVALEFGQVRDFLTFLCGFLGEVVEVHRDQAVIAGVVEPTCSAVQVLVQFPELDDDRVISVDCQLAFFGHALDLGVGRVHLVLFQRDNEDQGIDQGMELSVILRDSNGADLR